MLEVRNISYSYRHDARPVLSDVSFQIQEGEHVAILGANGAGKSTLVRMLNGSLAPTQGHVFLDGESVSSFELAQAVGLVRQDPRSQIVSASLTEEVAFGPRNLGLSQKEIQQRVAEALELCELEGLVDHGTTELSGGQQQRLALAGVLAMHPSYLVLDEALSQLDSQSRQDLSKIIASLVKQGVGIISITHRFEELQGVDRVLVLSHGELVWEGVPQTLLSNSQQWKLAGVTCDGLDEALPFMSEALSNKDNLWDITEVASWVDHQKLANEVLERLPHPPTMPYALGDKKQGLLEAEHICASYGKTVALNDFSACFEPGTITVIGGASGSGKSTLARILAGVAQPDSGEARLGGKAVYPASVGLAFQRPEDQLFSDTVLDDIAFGPKSLGKSEEEALCCARKACAQLDIPESLFGRHPLALSGGQRRLVALAGLVALDTEAYVLDEPTAGLDAVSSAHLHDLVCKLAQSGKSIVVVSHDLGEWLALAQKVYLLKEGCIVWSGTTHAAIDNPDAFLQASLALPAWIALTEKLRECEK